MCVSSSIEVVLAHSEKLAMFATSWRLATRAASLGRAARSLHCSPSMSLLRTDASRNALVPLRLVAPLGSTLVAQVLQAQPQGEVVCQRLQSTATVMEPPPAPPPKDGDGGKPVAKAEADAEADEPKGWLQFLLPLLDLGLLLAGALCTLGAVGVAVSIPARSAALLKAAKDGLLTVHGVLRVLGLVQLQASLRMLASLFLIKAGDRTKRRLKERLFASVLAQELGFVSMTRPSALVANLSEDTDKLGRAVTQQLSLAVNAVGGVLGGVYQLFQLSPQLTGLTLLIVPPIALFASAAHKVERRMSRRAAKANATAVNYAGEVFNQLLTVQAYAQEEGEKERYGERLQVADAEQQRVTLFHKTWAASFHLLTNSAMVVAACYAGNLALRGQLDESALVSFMQLSTRIGESVASLLFLSNDVSKTIEAATRLQAVIEREPLIPPDKGATLDLSSPFLRGEMALHDVTFAYPSRADSPALNGCNLTLKPGQVTAVVGPSGGGKTTVTRLLARFFEPDAGTVTLDGADVRTLQARWLRGVVGVVSQEPVLLPGTVADNIAYGRPDATPAQIEAAARESNAHEFIERLSDGYQTQLRGDGGGLSVGQRQRIAIARALLKDPKVLLLDEPTSALDAESEAAVQQALDRLVRGRTVLLIAHRLSTVVKADAIVVLVGGKVVERGTHDELMAANGEYAHLVATQMRATDESKEGRKFN